MRQTGERPFAGRGEKIVFGGEGGKKKAGPGLKREGGRCFVLVAPAFFRGRTRPLS